MDSLDINCDTLSYNYFEVDDLFVLRTNFDL